MDSIIKDLHTLKSLTFKPKLINLLLIENAIIMK